MDRPPEPRLDLSVANPRGNRLEDQAMTERRIAAFVVLGLDDFRIRAWTVIRGASCAASLTMAARIRALLA